MEKKESIDELLSFVEKSAKQELKGAAFVQQGNYVYEEPIMADEDVAGREPLQVLRVIIETGDSAKYFEYMFYTAAELEEMMTELQPVFDRYPKKVLSEEEMDEKAQAVKG